MQVTVLNRQSAMVMVNGEYRYGLKAQSPKRGKGKGFQ
jgi:hypothetical protein